MFEPVCPLPFMLPALMHRIFHAPPPFFLLPSTSASPSAPSSPPPLPSSSSSISTTLTLISSSFLRPSDLETRPSTPPPYPLSPLPTHPPAVSALSASTSSQLTRYKYPAVSGGTRITLAFVTLSAVASAVGASAAAVAEAGDGRSGRESRRVLEWGAGSGGVVS